MALWLIFYSLRGSQNWGVREGMLGVLIGFTFPGFKVCCFLLQVGDMSSLNCATRLQVEKSESMQPGCRKGMQGWRLEDTLLGFRGCTVLYM